MKLKFLTSIIGAGVLLVGTSAFALTETQKAEINTQLNAASTTDLPSVAAQALSKNCDCANTDSVSGPCISFIVNAAKAKLGPNASIASVRNLVNALVLACPTKAALVVGAAASAFPGMKANIAAAAQTALTTAAANGTISQAQATSLSTAVNQTVGITGTAGVGRGGSLFQANQALASAAARVEFQRSNVNNVNQPNPANYSQP